MPSHHSGLRPVQLAAFFLLLFFKTGLYAQTPGTAPKLAELTPPSPTAYALGKYGQTPAGLFTGTAMATIPLYEYKTRNLSVPVSLSYSSNGIKVDELGSNVGLGWSLNAGGVISCMVRDFPDNKGTYFIPEDELHTNPASLTSPMVLDYFNMIGNEPNIDSETDLYMFNFNGYAGKFVFDNDHKLVMLPKQDMKIENIIINGNDGFRITTADGIQYNFLEKEKSQNRPDGSGGSGASYPFSVTAWYLSSIKHPSGDEVTFIYGEAFSYTYISSKQQSLTVVPNYQYSCPDNPTAVGYHTVGPVINYNSSVRGKRLTEIRSNVAEEGRVLFTSGFAHPEVTGYQLISAISVVDKTNQETERFNFTYLSTPNKRVFLQKVAEKDPNKNHQLEYITPASFPNRLSFSQDHWGYYNGKPNGYAFPDVNTLEGGGLPEIAAIHTGGDKSPDTAYAQQALLKRITYPTKGYTDFTYEANNFRTSQQVLPPPQVLNVGMTTTAGQTGNRTVTGNLTNIGFSQVVPLGPSILFNTDDPDCHDLGKTRASIAVTDLTTSTSVPINGTNTIPFYFVPGMDVSGLSINVESGHSYEVKLTLFGACIVANVSLKYYQGSPVTVQVNKITGGLRIQKAETNDGISATPLVTRYYYGKKESPGISTGIAGNAPTYVKRRINRVYCPLFTYFDIYYFDVSSNSLDALYNSIGTTTPGYGCVTMSIGGNNFENGGEEHQFIIDYDVPGKIIYGANIPTATWTYRGTLNGKESKVQTFKKNGANGFIVVKEQTNSYKQDDRYYEEVFGYATEKKCDRLPQPIPVNYTCKLADVNRSWLSTRCDATHSYVDENGNTVTGEHIWKEYTGGYRICIAQGALPPEDQKITVHHPCYYTGENSVITRPDGLENLNIMEYYSVSRWEYLNSRSITLYDLNGANPVTTVQNFFYDNPVHLQLTRTETSNTGGSVIKEKTYYPDDVTSVSSLPGGNLATDEWNVITSLNKNNQYRINTPVQVEHYLGTVKRNTTRTIYKQYGSLILPGVVRTLTGEATSTNVLRDRVNYYTYDATGNILETSLSNDISTSYLWGYSGTYPIAIAKNAHANEILYNGFEELSGWDGNLTAYDATRSHTGKYSGRIDKSTAGEQYSMGTKWLTVSLGKTTRFKYSGWVYSNGPSVDLLFFMKKAGETGYYTYVSTVSTSVINKWVYLEGEFDVPINITQLNIRVDNNGGGSVWFDDIRLHPAVAQMSTFTYQPLVGLTSATLPNQQLTKYEYDPFNRLKLIRNGDNAILQRSQYKYK